ncbi:MAG: hypothetical protein ACM3N9_01710 [Syntrophothermus sp.]
MRKLPLIFIICLLIFPSFRIWADSPHGKDFKVSCSQCHTSESWKFEKSIYSFNHDKTVFPLTGQHEIVSCRSCHRSLVFSEAPGACNACHTDLHENTVGHEFIRCNTTSSCIVNNITYIHSQ